MRKTQIRDHLIHGMSVSIRSRGVYRAKEMRPCAIMPMTAAMDKECRFRSYWNMTGVPTLAVNRASRFTLSGMFGNALSVPMTTFTSFDISELDEGSLSRESMLALLYDTGI